MITVVKHLFKTCVCMFAFSWSTYHTLNSKHCKCLFLYICTVTGKGNTESLMYNTYEPIHCIFDIIINTNDNFHWVTLTVNTVTIMRIQLH